MQAVSKVLFLPFVVTILSRVADLEGQDRLGHCSSAIDRSSHCSSNSQWLCDTGEAAYSLLPEGYFLICKRKNEHGEGLSTDLDFRVYIFPLVFPVPCSERSKVCALI